MYIHVPYWYCGPNSHLGQVHCGGHNAPTGRAVYIPCWQSCPQSPLGQVHTKPVDDVELRLQTPWLRHGLGLHTPVRGTVVVVGHRVLIAEPTVRIHRYNLVTIFFCMSFVNSFYFPSFVLLCIVCVCVIACVWAMSPESNK